jgi:hypothetical protein
MEQLIHRLQQDFPAFRFTLGEAPCWSPSSKQIAYQSKDTATARLSVLHELGHALLGHETYHSDASLLQKETSAWSKAVALAKQYGIAIDSDHVQNCLDTYRDWLHRRSTCPRCHSHGIQQDRIYTCFNCARTWRVSSARFCRPYRATTY